MVMSMEISQKRAEMIEQNDAEYDVKLNEFEKDLTEYRGAYSTFAGSPLSKGKFQFDLWGIEANMYTIGKV